MINIKNKFSSVLLLLLFVISACIGGGAALDKTYAAGANLALKKEAFASSMYNDSGVYAPEKINDGNYSTLWSDGAVKYTGPVAGYYYIAVDLAEEFIINQIIAYPRIDFDDSDQLHNWYIQLSNTRDFSDAVTVAHIESKCVFGGNFVFDVELEDSFRYVRIASPKAYFTCGELEVYGEKYDPETMNGKNNFADMKESPHNGAAAVCDALGIINAAGKASFEGEKMMTRAAAAKAVAVMMQYSLDENEKSIFSDVPDNYYLKSYIVAGYRNNVISKSDSFRPDEYITQGELCKMILYAFGYERNVESYNDWRAGTSNNAKALKLLKNVDGKFDDKLNRAAAAEILFNALKAPLNKVTFYQSNLNMPLLEASDNNALYDLYKMKIAEGVISENSASDLNHMTYDNSSHIVINKQTYMDDDGLLQTLIGKSAGILIDEYGAVITGYEDTTINEITRVYSDSFLDASDGVYSYEEGKSQKRIRFSEKEVYVLKNYCALTDWTYDDLSPADGYVEFIDNDKNGKIDVISIFEPEVMIGGYILPSDGNINVVGKDGQKITVIKPSWTRFIRAGKITTPGKFVENDVIYVYRSENDAILFIEGYNERKTQIVDTVGPDTGVIASNEYILSDYYKNLTDKDQKLKIGESNTVLFDSRGRIICAVNAHINKDVDIFGFVCTAYIDTDDDELYVNIYTEKGDFGRFNFADSVKADDIKLKAEAIKNQTENGELEFKNKIVKFRLNADGKINRIDMLKNTGAVLGDNVVYIKNGHGVYNKGWLVQPLMPETICFTIPKSGNEYVYRGYENQYKTDSVKDHMSELSQIKEKWDFYDADDLGYPSVAVRYKEVISSGGMEIHSVNSSNDTEGLIVKSVYMCIDENDEFAYAINGFDMSGNQKSILLSPEIENIFRSDDIQGEHFEWLNDNKDVDIDRLGAEDIINYTMPVGDLKAGDMIRYEISDDKAVAVERTYKAYSGKNGIYQRTTDGTYYSAGKTYPQYPDAEYRLVYGLAQEIKKDVFIMTTCERRAGEGALTQYVSYNDLARLIIINGKSFEVYNGSDLPAYMEEGLETVLFTTDRAKPGCLILYK